MTEYRKSRIDNFLSSISQWEESYTEVAFNYIATKQGDQLHLLYGRIILSPVSSLLLESRKFESKNILAGVFLIADTGVDLKNLIMNIFVNQRIKSPEGELIFPVSVGEDMDVYFNGLHMDGINSGKRMSYLRLSGASRHSFLRQPDTDWELKAASYPYDSLLDLMTEYSLNGCELSDRVNVEVIAHNIVEINQSSVVDGESAQPSLILAKSLDPKKCILGYRIFSDGKIYSRGSLHADDFVWSESSTVQNGVGTLKIPVGAALHCFASYAGQAQHQYWLADLKNFPNSRRALLEESDNEFKILRDYLFNEQKPRKASRDFEFGVALLLWMLGFSTSQPGSTPRTTDSVDIIASTTKGNVLLVECTVGLLKADSKLATLIARTEAIKRRMQIGHRHLVIIPVLVTAMTREEVRSDLKDAHEHGVVVLAKEDLTQMLGQTITITDSDIYFDQLVSTIQSQQHLS